MQYIWERKGKETNVRGKVWICVSLCLSVCLSVCLSLIYFMHFIYFLLIFLGQCSSQAPVSAADPPRQDDGDVAALQVALEKAQTQQATLERASRAAEEQLGTLRRQLEEATEKVCTCVCVCVLHIVDNREREREMHTVTHFTLGSEINAPVLSTRGLYKHDKKDNNGEARGRR